MTGTRGPAIDKVTDICISVLSLSLTVALGWVLFQYVLALDLMTLASFKDRAIGVAVLYGLDPSIRTKVYVGLVLLSITAYLGFYGLLRYAYARYIDAGSNNIFRLLTAGVGVPILFVSVYSACQWYFRLVDGIRSEPVSTITTSIVTFLTQYGLTVPVIAVVTLGFCYILASEKKFFFSPDDPLRSPTVVLTMLTLAVTFLYLLSGLPDLLVPVKMLVMLWIIAVVSIAAKTRSSGKVQAFITGLLSNFPMMIAILATALAPFFIYGLLVDGRFLISDAFFILYPAISLSVTGVYYLLQQRAEKSNIKLPVLDQALLVLCCSFVTIPLLIPVINELQFTLTSTLYVPIRYLEPAIMAAIVLVSVAGSIAVLKGKWTGIKPSDLVQYFYFPVLIGSAIVYKYCHQYLSIASYDMFHDGEKLITTQQFFSFGSLPFINSYPTHGLSDSSYQILYSLFNGYSPVEPLLWEWVPYVIFAVLLYFLVRELAGATLSFAAILFLPLIGIFGNSHSMDFYYYALALLPALLIVRALAKMSYSRLIAYWLTIVFLTLWRVDFGATGLVSSFFVMGLYFLSRRELEPAGIVRDLWKPTITLVITAICAVGVLLLLISLGNESIAGIISQNMQFISFQDAAMAYADLVPDHSPLTMLLALSEYVLLPVISIAVITYGASEVIFKRKSLSHAQIIIIFLAVFSLVGATRSLQRHSLIEYYNPGVFLFLAACVPFFLGIKKQVSAVLFIGILTISVALAVSITPALGQGMISKGLLPSQDTEFYAIHDWEHDEPRINTYPQQNQQMIDFLNGSLDDNQTFFDFTNSPILYVFTDKKDLTYLVPDMYLTSEVVQRQTVEKLEAANGQGRLPIVIFKERGWGDTVDNVPNEMRSYRIAEFIYQNYKPEGYLGTYQIWSTMSDNVSYLRLDDPEEIEHRLELTKEIRGSSDLNITSSVPLTLDCGDSNPQIFGFTNVDAIEYTPGGSSYSYLKIRYNSSLQGDIQAFYSFDDGPFGEQMASSGYILRPNTTSEMYLRIPPAPMRLTDIRIDPPPNSRFEIESVSIVEKSVYIEPAKAPTQNFNLKLLPYIWGQYDPQKASTQTLIQANVSDGVRQISEEGATFSFDPAIDKSTGNYIHMRIKSNETTTVDISYGSTRSGISFEVVPSADYKDYLVRISSQWIWFGEPIDRIDISSDRPVTVEGIWIRKGD